MQVLDVEMSVQNFLLFLFNNFAVINPNKYQLEIIISLQKLYGGKIHLKKMKIFQEAPEKKIEFYFI